MQHITHKGHFNAAVHFLQSGENLHGHTYVYELTFCFGDNKPIGFPIDFREIENICCEWIEKNFNDATLVNPEDEALIEYLHENLSKAWIMTLAGTGYCNPTLENIAREILLSMEFLFEAMTHIQVSSIRIYSTPDTFTDCNLNSATNQERLDFMHHNYDRLMIYAQEKGLIKFDPTE